MTANPLKLAGYRPSGGVTEDMLHSMVATLNCNRFVTDSGKPYFVNRMVNGDGTFIHFLDR